MEEICLTCQYADKINKNANDVIDLRIDVGIAKGEIEGVKEDMKEIKDSIKTINTDIKASKNFQIATMASVLVSIGLMVIAVFIK
jgi:hypothetical protein